MLLDFPTITCICKLNDTYFISVVSQIQKVQRAIGLNISHVDFNSLLPTQYPQLDKNSIINCLVF